MVLDRLRDALSSDGDGGGSGVTMPSDPGVVDAVSSGVDMSHSETRETVEKFQEMSHMIQPMIADASVGDRAAQHRQEEDSSSSFIYTVYEDEDVLAVGGARSIVMGLTERLDYDSVERKAVVLAHRHAAEDAGLSEHTVMDDVFMLPKQRTSEGMLNRGEIDVERRSDEDADEALRRRMELVQEVDEDGFELRTPDGLADSLDLESKKLLGVDHGHGDDEIRLVFDPRQSGDAAWPGVIDVDGAVSIPEGVADVLDLGDRETEWRVRDGRIVCVIEGRLDETDDTDGATKTKVKGGAASEGLRAVLPSDHADGVGLEEDDSAGFYVDAFDDDLHAVVSPEHDAAMVEIEIEEGGPETELLAFTLPDYAAEVLDVEEGDTLEWRLHDYVVVGRASR